MIIQKTKARPWTEDEKEYVRVNYRRNGKSLELIALHLNRTADSITSQISRQGLTNGRENYKKWSEDDLEFLRENYGEITADKLQRVLNRSMSTITKKAWKLGLKRFTRSDWYTIEDASKIFGVGLRTARQWIDSGKLNADKVYNLNDGRVRVHRISKDGMRKFIRRYPMELQGRNLDVVQLVEILSGILYDNPCTKSIDILAYADEIAQKACTNERDMIDL